MNFGDILRKLIDERELTQKQVANDLNIAPSTIGGYVQNTSEPDFATLKLMAEYFNVSADYFLDLRIGKTDTRQEDEFLRVFRSILPEQREIYLEQGKAFIKHNHHDDIGYARTHYTFNTSVKPPIKKKKPS
jgi:transcriptional regulator with XRE-family HTH domain